MAGEEINTESLESALGNAFGGGEAPKQQQAAPVAPQAAPEPPVDEPVGEEDPADLLQGLEPDPVEEPAKDVAEPEFEIEIEPGKPEVIKGAERVKELLARGLKAGRGFEENARVREALAAHAQQAQFQQQFQQAVSQDIAQLQALDHQLQAYDRYDWNAAYDADPFAALKLKEQRDHLREQRAAAINNLNAKQQQFQAQAQQNAQRLLAAENEALLAKVPAWRNPEKANQERGEIVDVLRNQYGFTAQELNQIMDHRVLVVARDAAAYRKLLANKDARVKQARTAPAIAKPGAAAAPTNGRAEFNKFRGKVRELGTKGNHKAQESLVTAALERAFK